jgi:hypothetical protein
VAVYLEGLKVEAEDLGDVEEVKMVCRGVEQVFAVFVSGEQVSVAFGHLPAQQDVGIATQVKRGVGCKAKQKRSRILSTSAPKRRPQNAQLATN